MKRALLIGGALTALATVTWALWPSEETTGDTVKPQTDASRATRTLAQRLEDSEGTGQLEDSDGGVRSYTGSVVDEEGNPVAGAEVTVFRVSGQVLGAQTCPVCEQPIFECADSHSAREILELLRAGRGQPKAIATTPSGADGSFRFDELPQQQLMVFALKAQQSTWEEIYRDEEPALLVLSAPPKLSLKVNRFSFDVEAEPMAVPGARVSAVSLDSLRLVEGVSDGTGALRLDGLDEGMGVWVFVEAPGLLPYIGTVYADLEQTEVVLEPARALIVTTSVGGKPIEAEVRLGGGRQHPATFRAQGGRVRIDGLGSDELEVFAVTDSMISPKQLTMLEGEVTTVDFELRASARLLVTVIDETGQPVENAEVTAADNLGEYSSGNSNLGDLVVLGPLGEGSISVDVAGGDFRPWHREIDLRPGENPLEVILKKGVKVRGQVVDGEGKPVIQAVVEAPALVQDDNTAYTDHEGNFELSFDGPGPVELRAAHVAVGRATLTVNAPADAVVIRLDPKARLKVVVREGRTPVDNVRVMVTNQDGEASQGPASATIEDGSVTFSGLESGPHQVLIHHTDFRQQLPFAVTLSEGRVVTLDVQLDRGMSVSGVVVDARGNPVVGAGVHTEPYASDAATDEAGRFTLVTLDPALGYELLAETDLARSVPLKFKGPQGSLRVVLQDRPLSAGRVVDAVTGVGLQQFEVDYRSVDSPDGTFSVPINNALEWNSGLTIDISADGYEVFTWSGTAAASANLGTIRLGKARQVEGVVRDARGSPVAGALVLCDLMGDEVTTAGDGSFRMSMPRFEEGALLTARRGQLKGNAPVALGRLVEIVLAPPTRVLGQVIDAEGRPVQGTVWAREQAGEDEVRIDAGSDGSFTTELAAGRWTFVTRLNASGQSMQIAGPSMRVVLGTPPGSCAINVVTASVPDELVLLSGDAAPTPDASFEQLASLEGSVVIDSFGATRQRAAGFRCGAYTLLARWGGVQSLQRLELRAGPNEVRLSSPVTQIAQPDPR